MAIKEIYEKYKHLDKILSDEEWIKNTLPASDTRSFKDCVLFDLWQAVKEEIEEREIVHQEQVWCEDLGMYEIRRYYPDKEEGRTKEMAKLLSLQQRLRGIKENAQGEGEKL